VSEACKANSGSGLSRFTPYPTYKDSRVEWLGEIPAHWTVTVLKRIGNLQGGAGFSEDEQGLESESIPFFKVGDMGSRGNEREMIGCPNTISEATARRLRAFVFPPRTIVFAKVGAALLLNRRRILVQLSCIDNNMMGFLPEKCDYVWAFHWLCGLDLRELANPGAVPSVNEGQMRDIPVALPPEPDQRTIAAFLDRETARIDALVAKKERLIELLQEKRAALITQAVTKGLDPNVPMKDSGVEWLGKIPTHWEVKPLTKYLLEKSDYRGKTPEKITTGIFLVTARNVRMGQIDYECSQEFVVEEDYAEIMRRGLPKKGDILFTTEAPLGNVALVDREDIALAQRIIRFRTNPKHFDSRFTLYAMMSDYFQSQLLSLSTGSTAEGLKASKLTMLRLAGPPLRVCPKTLGGITKFSEHEAD
jgi:type I restriction enzyme, S subunit